ncbi:hypothetical protein N9K35_01610 [Pseudomonadales bacterium]|nr:hypothetical protein [Pseudomonadales bacterium]
MANEITMKLKSPIEVLNKDFEIVAKKNGKKLGTMLISKGNVEWLPVGNSKNKKRLSWDKFAQLMVEHGKDFVTKD